MFSDKTLQSTPRNAYLAKSVTFPKSAVTFAEIRNSRSSAETSLLPHLLAHPSA